MSIVVEGAWLGGGRGGGYTFQANQGARSPLVFTPIGYNLSVYHADVAWLSSG